MSKAKKVYVDKTYKLLKDVAPLAYMLPIKNSKRTPLLYFDEELGYNRELRYASNQKSPFVDKQDGHVILESVVFEDGFLHVPSNKQTLQEFLHHHPYNGKKFSEVDKAKDAQEVVESIISEAEALIKAKELTIDQTETVCRVALTSDVSKMTSAELKRDVLVFAKTNPSEFLNIINDPELKLSATIRKFFEEGMLQLRKSGKEVWYNTPNNKKKMLNVPYNTDAFDITVSFLKSDDGLDQLKYLESLVAEATE